MQYSIKNSKKYLLIIVIITSLGATAQKKLIKFQSNKNETNENLKNPFEKFIGEWTLKNDGWTQNWGGETETIKIPDHHTIVSNINTSNSILSIVDGPEPNGHIFWSYSPKTEIVNHLSSFGTTRQGKGLGTIAKNGDLSLKIYFEDEPEGTYRMYTYTWLNSNEYVLKSVQFNQNDKPTGLFYGGHFIRIDSSPKKNIKNEVQEILNFLDDNSLSLEEQLTVFTEDLVHMAPNNEVITNKHDLLDYLQQQRKIGRSEMKHDILELSVFDNIVLIRGGVSGTFHPSNNDKPFVFRTKNLFVFKRVNEKLKIEKVIYNRSPTN